MRKHQKKERYLYKQEDIKKRRGKLDPCAEGTERAKRRALGCRLNLSRRERNRRTEGEKQRGG